MQRILVVCAIAVTALTSPLGAQGGGRGRVASGQRCPGCDSIAMAGAVRRSIESEISGLTISLAQNRILIEHLRARLAEGSPDAPRSDRERAELEARLVVQRREMDRLERELSARCGDAGAARGYMGLWVSVSGLQSDSGGKSTFAFSYPIVTDVEPGSPAARAGIAVAGTIVSINKLDARSHSFDAFGREPGDKLTVGVVRGDSRHELTVVVAPRPATFGGACLQYRNVVFADPTGQSIVTMRAPGGRGAGGTTSGTFGARAGGGAGAQVSVTGQGRARQPVRIQMSPDSVIQSATFFIVPSGAGATALFMSRGAGGAIVAGAEVALINGGLKTVFAVDHGALVVNVAPRSPADQAGILSGDVIVGAQGEAVTTIPVLQRAIQAAGDRRSVMLDVIRAKQPMTITLRW